MERKRSAPLEGHSLPPWRTRKEYEVKLGVNIEEEDDDDDDKEEEDARDDCLFGTKTETRRSIGKCDRLEREEELKKEAAARAKKEAEEKEKQEKANSNAAAAVRKSRKQAQGDREHEADTEEAPAQKSLKNTESDYAVPSS